MRQQYHIRKVGTDNYIWNVNKLILNTKNISPIEIMISEINELNESYWNTDSHLTCKDIALHAKLIFESDLKYPILLCPDKKVIDGMHRVCKAYLENKKAVMAVVLTELPQADYINVKLETLPY